VAELNNFEAKHKDLLFKKKLWFAWVSRGPKKGSRSKYRAVLFLFSAQ